MKKFILLAGILLLAAACAENKSSDTGSSYQITGKVIYTADNFKSAKVCVDANNNGLADDADCAETAGDGSYSFISNDSITNYPLAASITTANTAVNARLNNGEILMYAPKGKADVISIETTLIKSIMEQNSTKTYDMADAEVAAIMKKTDNKTLLTVYTNALNSADIQNWESSIRGIVGAVTNKLLESTEITADTIITVTQEEVDNINNIIKEEDNNEPQQPENPGTEPATPLEKVTEMLAGAEIKNSAENPVNLNEHLDPLNNEIDKDGALLKLGIKSDAFGEYSSNMLMTSNQLLRIINYKEENWPSDSPLEFEILVTGNVSYGGYYLTNYPSNISIDNITEEPHSDNVCGVNGKINGIYYKSVFDTSLYDTMEAEYMLCYKQNGGINDPSLGSLDGNDMKILVNCFAEAAYNNKNNIKIEKWYWTIDTSLLEECK